MARYIGLDVHKHVIEVCLLSQEGKIERRLRLSAARSAIQEFARAQLQPSDQVALEATTNTWAVADLLRPHVQKLIVSNPRRTRAIAQAKIKTDKVDAQVLAQLLRCDYVPEVWQPDQTTQDMRQLTGYRASLVSDQTRIKNRIRSILAQRLIEPPMAMLFSNQGLLWLKTTALPASDRLIIDSQVRLLRTVGQ